MRIIFKKLYKAKVKEDLIIGKNYAGVIYTRAMNDFKGKTINLSKAFKDSEGWFVRQRRVLNASMYWSFPMFENWKEFVNTLLISDEIVYSTYVNIITDITKEG